MTLDQIVARYDRAAGQMGPEPIRDNLVEDLTAHRRQQAFYANLQIGLLVLLTLLAVGALTFDLADGGRRYLVLGGAGISVPTLLALLRGTIRETAGTDLFLVLVKNSTEREARALLQKRTKQR